MMTARNQDKISSAGDNQASVMAMRVPSYERKPYEKGMYTNGRSVVSITLCRSANFTNLFPDLLNEVTFTHYYNTPDGNKQMISKTYITRNPKVISYLHSLLRKPDELDVIGMYLDNGNVAMLLTPHFA